MLKSQDMKKNSVPKRYFVGAASQLRPQNIQYTTEQSSSLKGLAQSKNKYSRIPQDTA